MTKQCLDVQQMQHLQELGVDTSKANFYWHRTKSFNNYEEWDEWKLHYGVLRLARGFTTINCQYVRTFTLQDILDLLPVIIEHDYKRLELRIKRFVFENRKVMYAVLYENQDYVDWFVMQSYETLIDAAYEMLVWAIENKFVETNKNE